VPISISATINADAGQLQNLEEIPRRIETLVETARTALEAVRSGQDGGNPLGALLTALGGVGEVSEQLPSFDAVLQPISEVTGRLPDRALADIAATRASVESALGFFGEGKDLILSGRLDQVLEQGVGRVLDAATSRLRPGDEVNAMFGELAEFFRLFGSLLEWRSRPPSAEQLADFLARVLIGAPRDVLQRPVQLVDAALRPLEQLLPPGADLTLWRTAHTERTAFWAGIEASFATGVAVDWARIEGELRTEARRMLEARAARDRLLSQTITALAGVRLDASLSSVGPAAAAVPKLPDFRLSALLQGLRAQIESIATDLESWSPTPEEARALVRRLTDGLREFLEKSPLGQLRNLLLDFQHRLLVAIESLPFTGFAREAERFLRDIAVAIDSLDAESLTRPIQDFFTDVENRIQTGGPDAVRNAVEGLWENVDNAFAEINGELATLRQTLEELVGNLTGLLEQLQPAIEKISESVGRIKLLLDEFDILEAADLVVEELHKLRDQVAELDYSKLPSAALSVLHEGAQLLRGIDVAGAVNPPLSEELAKVDPAPLLRQASTTIGGALNQLQQFDPQSIVQLLDRPVDELLTVLRDFGPDRLRALIQEALRPVEDAVRGLDATQLLAPVTRLFAELTVRIDSILNPDVIFAPLEEVFRPVETLIDAIEPGRLLSLVAPHSEHIGETVGSAAGPPSVMTSAGSTLKQSIGLAPEADEPLFGFRPGDLLIPLIDIYRKFREVFDPIDATVVEPAVRLLREAFQLSLQALQPQTISLRAEAALSVIVADFDPAAVSDRLALAVDGYHAAAARLASAARTDLSAGDAAIVARIRLILPDLNPLLLVPAPTQVEGVLTASASVRATIDLSAIRAAIPGLNAMQRFLPAFLSVAEGGVNGLRQFIDDLDPSRLRIQINETFDRIGRRIVALQEPLMAGIDELMAAVEDFLLPISPGHIVELARRLHAALKEQILALSPARLKDDVKPIFDAVKAKLNVFDPQFIADQLNGLRDALLQTLREMVDGLLPDMSGFVTLQERVAALKPSQLLQPAVEALQPVSDLIAQLDVSQVFEPLIDAIDRVRNDLPEVVSRIEGALDEVLDAIPEGGTSSASASVSIG
jgi:hypothetical protein